MGRHGRQCCPPIAIDDFGAGFCAFALLQHLPIDMPKFDRSPIADLPDKLSDVANVGAIVAMAGSLGISVTAAGIEHESQRDLPRLMDCERGQGHLFAAALPADDLATWLGAERAPRPG